MKLAKILAITIALSATSAEAAPPQAKPAQPSQGTESFIKNAAIGNKFEILSSQLAVDKSGDNDVKLIGQRMIEDHRKTATDLKSAVDAANIKLPEDNLDTKHQSKLNELKNAKGAEFDKEYIKAQQEAHVEAITLFENYSQNGDEKSLKDFATSTLPALKQHQEHIAKFKAKNTK